MEPALSYMSVFHPKPIYRDAACWLGVPLRRGWLSLLGTVGCQAEPGRTRIGATVSVGIGPLSCFEADPRLRRNRIRPQPTAGFT